MHLYLTVPTFAILACLVRPHGSVVWSYGKGSGSMSDLFFSYQLVAYPVSACSLHRPLPGTASIEPTGQKCNECNDKNSFFPKQSKVVEDGVTWV
jgi:hypothetical protein